MKTVVIFVEGDFLPPFSGASNRLYNIAYHLQDQKYANVVVILADRGWSNIQDLRVQKFNTILVNPIDFYSNHALLERILKPYNVDILQFCNFESCYHVGINLANSLRAKLIFEAHYDDAQFSIEQNESQQKIGFIRKLTKELGTYLDGIVCLSSDEVKDIVILFNIDKKRVRDISSGVTPTYFSVPQSDRRSKKILFIGNLFFEPNSLAVRSIFHNVYPVLKNEYKFVMIGDYPTDLFDECNEINFEFVGCQKDLLPYFKGTLCGLAPILQGAGQRIKMLLYASAGLPIICSTEAAKGFPFKELLFVEDNIDKYSILIKSLKSSRKYYSVSKNIFQRAHNELNWENQITILNNFYEEVINKPPVIKSPVSPYPKNYSPPWLKELIFKGRFQNCQGTTKINNPIQIK